MTTKLVIRLLDAAGEQLLGWAEVRALARGDGCLWATHPVLVPIDVAGTVGWLSIHWADVHVESRVPIDPHPVTSGSAWAAPFDVEPVLRIGTPPVSLPPVTARSTVRIGVPTGGLGLRLA